MSESSPQRMVVRRWRPPRALWPAGTAGNPGRRQWQRECRAVRRRPDVIKRETIPSLQVHDDGSGQLIKEREIDYRQGGRNAHNANEHLKPSPDSGLRSAADTCRKSTEGH